MTGSFFHTFYKWSKSNISIIVLVFSIAVSVFPVNEVLAQGLYIMPTTTNSDGSTSTKLPTGQTANTSAPAAGKTQTTQITTPSTSKSSSDIQCVLSDPFSGTLMGCAAQLGFMILGLAAWVLWVAAVLFNFAIPYTLNMASFLKDVPIVALGWTTFRDLANIFFIFIVLYIAISTIIGNEGFGIKKLLGKVIVGAVLINFSLFFTQAMIDVSNIFTLEFYNKITQTDGAKTAVSGTNTQTNAPGVDASKLDSGISASLVNALGLETIWNIGKSDAGSSGAKGIDPNQNAATLGLNATNLLIASMGGTILVLITAFIFFAAVIMFLGRAVTLIFLMILSPIAFLGNVLPAIGKYTGEWWSKLFNNLLFAPAYMALLYLVISIVADPNKFSGIGGSKGSFVAVFAGDSNMIGAVMTFFVLNMMMFACLIIASKFGVAGSKWAEKVGKGFATGVGMTFTGAGLAMGIGGGLGRGIIGGTADKMLQSNFIKNRAPNSVLRSLDSVRSAKFGGKSFKDVQKTQDDNLKKAYDLAGEVRQRSGESDDAFRTRKKKAQAAAYGKLGISADPNSGLPNLDPTTGDLLSTTSGVLVKNAKLSSSQRAILGNKDINEEGIQKKLAEEVYDKESSALKKAHRELRAKVIEHARKVKAGSLSPMEKLAGEISIRGAKAVVRSRKHDLEIAKINAGEKDLPKNGNLPGRPQGYIPA